jgi:hypothetical protein
MKYRTTLTAKAQILEPKTAEYKAVAASLKDRYGFDLKPQMDLLHVSACLVSAGDGVGVNDNDDIFTREEAWAARHTPVLKPFNWQHQDKDIVGVMYTVQARASEDGAILDIANDEVPDCDFDLYVEAAIFRLIHEDRAAEIEARAKASDLFVSMEAWFDDYSYGLFNPNNRSLAKMVARNKDTSFLDKHLRANSGAGVYHDPDTDQDMRIGRVLRSITFGGCGFVDRPANKRSVIEHVDHMTSFAERDTELQIERLLERVKVLESLGQEEEVIEEVTLMNTQANVPSDKSPEEIAAAAIDSALDKREKAAAEAKAKAELEARANEAEQKAAELEAQVQELTQVKEAKEAEVEALQSQMNEYGDAVDKLVQEQAAAGATTDTPAEIAAIDNTEDKFAAKLAWLGKSAAGLVARATRADELETQLAEAEAVVREQEVRSLLGDDLFSEEAVEVMVSRAADLDNDAYQAWRDEKELMIIEMSTAKKEDKKMPPFMKKGEDKKEEKEAKASNPFAALLSQRRSESGMADPDTMRNNPNEPDLINQNTGDVDVNSGVGPESLRTPRHKIAGSAGDNPADILNNVQEEGGVSLAGSQAGDDGVGVNPFRVLANTVTESVDESEDNVNQDKPDFDPVS